MTTISEALATAIQHHQAGRLQAAEQIYRQILQAEPDQPDALHLLGVIASQAGNHEIAAEYMVRAIGLKGNVATFHGNLGEVYRALRKLPEAVACYRRALELKPDFAEIHGNLGHALKGQGKLDEAVDCYRRALQLKPEQAEMHNSLGVAFKDQGKVVEAVACYRQALELKPDYPEAHNNLGNAFKDQGKFDEAVACYRQALELKPDYPEAHNNLGNAFEDLGEFDEAVACYRRALELKPGYAEAHNNLGVAFKEQGKLDDAVACCRRALELKPDYAEAHNNLGVALKDQGKVAEAITSYRRALELKPACAEIHNNLGVALKDQEKLDEAVDCFRRALVLKPDYAEAHVNLGSALDDQGKLAEAIACYRRALELKPDYAAAHSSLGGTLEEMGDLRGAEDSFRAALRHDPRFVFAHHKLAELLGGKLPQEDLMAQRQLLEQGSASGAKGVARRTTIVVAFRSGPSLGRAGRVCRGRRTSRTGQRAATVGLAKAWPGVRPARIRVVRRPDDYGLHAGFLRAVRDAAAGGFGLESELPVFVVGLPRSGTTLVEQILASHSQVFGAGETKLAFDTMAALGGQCVESVEGLCRLDRKTARRLASRHLEKLRALNSVALRIVDKMPENYLFLGLLASLFPRAKFIHCRRDLRDVAVSCWMTHFQNIRWANDEQHIASRFQAYQRMMQHWRKALPVPLLEVDYEETVANLEGMARKLIAWCGLAWEPKCLEFHQTKRPVRTASAVQVRQPVFRTLVGKWKHYEHFLGPLFARLPPQMVGLVLSEGPTDHGKQADE